MIPTDLISSIATMRPALPAKNYVESRRFYETIGFQARELAPTLTEMSLGTHSFLLQDFYVAQYANNFVMHVWVENLDAWWAHLEGLGLEKSFKVRAPVAPKLEPWGLRVAYLFDPSGVLWQISAQP